VRYSGAYPAFFKLKAHRRSSKGRIPLGKGAGGEAPQKPETSKDEKLQNARSKVIPGKNIKQNNKTMKGF